MNWFLTIAAIYLGVGAAGVCALFLYLHSKEEDIKKRGIQQSRWI